VSLIKILITNKWKYI